MQQTTDGAALATPTLPVLLVGNFGGTGARSIAEELALRLPQVGCPVVTTSSRRGRLARLVDMIRTTWAQRHQYAVAQVDVFSGPAFFWAEAVCATLRAARKPYVLTLHGGRLPQFARRHAGRVAHLLGGAAAVTSPSGYLLDALSGFRADIRLIPNGLDLAAYHARPRHGVEPRLVWLRAFHAIYNPDLAVRVLSRIRQNVDHAHLTMIGPDKGDGSLQQARRLAAELGVADGIEFRGAIAKHEVPDALGTADIFLNTTNVDNAPVSLLEAMASGLCVISTNVGGIPRLIDHETNGLLVPPDDAERMAAAVLRLVENPALAVRLSRNACASAERFDWAGIMDEWRALLTATVERDRGR